MYSTRKRVRRLANFGKISWWLEFHIFLCLVGPILIMYHTTFKAGGIAAISLWAMVSVVASGLVGRFLYDLIPHNTRGAELTLQEISSEIDQLASAMMVDPLGVTLIKMMDDAFKSIQRPETMMEVLSTVFRVEQIKLSTRSKIREIINRSHVPDRIAKQLRSASTARASLVQKSMLLNQVQKIFHYWHIIHLPFSIIMGVTLGAHVAVAIMLGYTWIA